MKMERSNRHGSLFFWATMATLLAQNLLIPVMARANFDDQKNYYSPDPSIVTPPSPTGSIPSPPHGSGGHHGGSSSPPSHDTPSHGGGCDCGGSPPPNCGKNPPSGSHHHHHNNPSPSPPSGGDDPSLSPPSPSGGDNGGGGYYSPPTPTTPDAPTYTPTPTTPDAPTYTPTPSTPDTPNYTPTPTTPDTPTPFADNPPSSPLVPTPPFGLEPTTPPFGFDPDSPPYTCDYWKSHSGLIWGLVGWWGTVGAIFGVVDVPQTTESTGSNMNLLQALSNTRGDSLGELYREGTASLLNSMVTKRFPYTTEQVRDGFVTALASEKAAGAQARLFKLANEGRRL